MSFNISLSGLQAAQKRLEVSGNNIANVGTVGFKSSRAEFAAVYASSQLGGGQPNGDGVRLANVSQNFTSGTAISSEGRILDMRIQGNGFFVMNDNGVINYSRAGAFIRDAKGFVVDNEGLRLQGYAVNASGEVIRGVRSDLSIDTSSMAPKATSTITEVVNLNASQVSRSAVPEFSPSDPFTYTKVISRRLMDNGVDAVPEFTRPDANGVQQLVTAGTPAVAPAEHELKQYFVKIEDNRWLMHTLVDGRNPVDFNLTTPLTATVTRNMDGVLSMQGDGKGLSARFKQELSMEGWQPAEQVGGNWGAAATPVVRAVALPLVDGDVRGMDMDDDIHTGSLAFDPGNATSYSRVLSSKIVDGAGAEHELCNYFTRVGPAQWTVHTLVDGRNPIDPASAQALKVSVGHRPNNQMLLSGDIAHVKKTTAREFTLDNWKPGREVNHTWVASTATAPSAISLQLSDGAIHGIDDGDAVMARKVTAFNPADSNSFSETFSSDIYDGQGNRHQLNQYYVKEGNNNWTLHMLINGRNPIDPMRSDPVTANMIFNSDGTLRSIFAGDGLAAEDGKLTLNGWTPARVVDSGAQTQKWLSNGALASPQGLSIDLTRLTQYNTKNNRSTPQIDGYAAGQISGLSLGGDGMLRASFSNGLHRNVGQVMLANFANEHGLRPLNNTRWQETFASGVATYEVPGAGVMGGLVAGSLEGSNTNMTNELLELIQAQTAYQANSKAVSTEATLLQTLLQAI